ncbi:SpoIID/LytB domain-containing protein [Mesobacillus foraminis]|uniref:SpoIID/LytB domain-containing protein n=1 Tax=Mesobacillus foraminis TaxID=279826 RepID=UPI001BEB121A|nr:SpoIID/LytB domain-containing protein [Mesobacillus foraminis]MBT2757242.1 SpoIID/LytB domain-containing protein [Mesobacillus foraminis]
MGVFRKGLLLGLVLTLILPFIPSLPAKAAGEPILQVKLRNYLGNTKEIRLYPEAEYSTSLAGVKLQANQSYTLKISGTNIVIMKGTSEVGKAAELEVKPAASDGPLSINSRPYLGSFKFVIDGGYLRPINSIGLEDYLKGVVPAEMPALWHTEALKAQTITARTYAMGYLNKIIDDTQSYQVYGGYTWHTRTTEAVQATEGKVISYGGKAIGSGALFSSSNGGKTESNSNAWGTAALPYLTIKSDPYDPKTAWSFQVKKQQIDVAKLDFEHADTWWATVKEAEQTPVIANIKAWLKANGYAGKDLKIAAVPDLSLHGVTSGGRVSKGSMTIEFLVKEADKAVLKRLEIKDAAASKIRSIISLSLMKSYLVNEVNIQGDTISVTGAGYGHGIGLSQYGAKKAAEQGLGYQDILGFYFDKTSITTAYQVPAVDAETKPDPAPVAPAPTPVEPIAAKPAPEASNPAPVVVTPAPETEKPAPETAKPAPVPTKPAPAPKKPAVVKDTKAPIIKSIKTTLDAQKNQVKLSFSTNEKAKITVYVKDQKGKIISYPLKNVQKSAGTQTTIWYVSKINNGKYSFGIIAVDGSHNRGSAVSNYTLSKPAVKKAAPKPAGKKKTGKVIATSLNIRSTASTKGKVVGTVKKNKTVTVLSKTGSWYKIQYGTKTGYVSAKYVSNVK